MGDRANLVISYNNTSGAETLKAAIAGALVLYSHWGGSDLGPDLAKALEAASGRWNDEAYGARIIVSQMVRDGWKSETGFGLLVGDIGDNEQPILLVDFPQQKVRLFGDAGKRLSPSVALDAKPTAEWTFAEFAAMTEKKARAAHMGA